MPRKSWWARLPFGVRMAAGTSALLLAVGGGAAGVIALTSGDSKPRAVATVGEAAASVTGPEADPHGSPPSPATARMGTDAATSRTDQEADRTATRTPRRDARPEPEPAQTVTVPPGQPPATPPGPVITTRTEVETREIPFETRMVRDPSLPRGARRVQTPGIVGEETLRYLVTLTDGQETDRRLLDTTVTRAPQHQVIAVGGWRGRGPDRCGAALNFCMPLGRRAMCPDGADRRVEEESATQLDGTIDVLDAEVQLPPVDVPC